MGQDGPAPFNHEPAQQGRNLKTNRNIQRGAGIIRDQDISAVRKGPGVIPTRR